MVVSAGWSQQRSNITTIEMTMMVTVIERINDYHINKQKYAEIPTAKMMIMRVIKIVML